MSGQINKCIGAFLYRFLSRVCKLFRLPDVIWLLVIIFVRTLPSYGPRLLLSVLGLGRNLFVRLESKFLRLWPLHWHSWASWGGPQFFKLILLHHSLMVNWNSVALGLVKLRCHLNLSFKKLINPTSCLDTKCPEFVQSHNLLLSWINECDMNNEQQACTLLL